MKAIPSLIRFCVIWVLAVGQSARAASVASPSRFDPSEIDAYLADQVKARGLPGLSVAIMRNGELVLAKAYGKSCLEPERLATPETMFAIGSVTKQFTSACILLLAEEGKLSVRDPVAKYFPQLTRADEITLLDLMNHVSGYPDYYPLDFVDRRMARPTSPDDLLRRYATGKLDFDPGTRWSYSNTGFVILGLVVEKVAGERFGAFLARRLFKPLGMDHTLYDPPRRNEKFAQGYSSFALGPLEPAEPEGAGWVAAAGAIWSTPSDLVKWDLALMSDKVLKPDSWKLMTTPRLLDSGRSTDYGCGLAVSTRNGLTVLTHGGMVSGFNADNALIPATHSALVMLSNSEFRMGRLDAEILSLLTKPSAALPNIAGLGATDAARSFFARLQSGKIDRTQLGEEFNALLSPARVVETSGRLKDFGVPTKVTVERLSERGGMEVANVRLEFQTAAAVRALMYRTPDGRIQEFLVLPE